MIPKANNDLNPLGIFFQREIYDKTYPSFANFPIPFDLWTERPLYGKSTNDGKALLLSQTNLKKIISDEENIFVLDFVANAFEDFRRLYNFSKIKNTVVLDNSNLTEIKAIRGWQNVTQTYNEYMNTLFQVFNETFIERDNLTDKITNFDNFIKVFISYIDSIINQYPILLSNFIKSKYNSPMSSGLMIELVTENHADDENKYRNFINDPNFSIYAALAQKHGFALDKNAPWRLIFDLKSKASEFYLQKFNLTVDKVFSERYYQNYFLDFESIKIYIIQFYNSLVLAKPFIEKTKVSKSGFSFTERIERKQVSLESINNLYPKSFWIRLYSYIRFREEKFEQNQNQFNLFVNRITQLSETQDLEKTLNFLNMTLERQKNFQKRQTDNYNSTEQRLMGEVRQFYF